MPFWRSQKWYMFQMNFNNFTFCNQVTFQNVALTNGFGHIFVLSSILLHHHVWLWSMFVTWCSFLHIFPILFQHFHFNIAWYHFREGNKMITILLRHDVLKSACGPKMSLCVMYFAPSLGSFFFSFSDWSKYIMCSLTFGPRVLQTTVCVTFFARRRSVPWSLLGGPLPT